VSRVHCCNTFLVSEKGRVLAGVARGLSQALKEFEQADEDDDADEDEDEDVDAPQYETATGVAFEAAHS
jgi:hypothetical protein